MIEWFLRLADIPGIGYPGNTQLPRASRPVHGTAPRVYSVSIDGKPQEILMWPTNTGETSASPAHQLVFAPSTGEEPSQDLLARLSHTLEVPGLPSDYHFAIQQCLEKLWSRRRLEPDLLPQVEQLCLLDLRLIAARPDIITYERDGETRFLEIRAFGHLIQLYEREGYLADAMAVAEQASRFHPEPAVERLRARLERVEAEG